MCKRCYGTGTTEDISEGPNFGGGSRHYLKHSKCTRCSGSGDCWKCNGTGKI